jgi:hypothetical protein
VLAIGTNLRAQSATGTEIDVQRCLNMPNVERVKRMKARKIISQRLHHYYELLVDIVDTDPEEFFQQVLKEDQAAHHQRDHNEVR